MSADVSVPGTRRSIGLTPAATDEATLFTAGAKGATVVWLCIANAESSANVATVKWNNGSTDYVIYNEKSVAADDSLMTEVHIELPAAGSIKVTSGDADEVTFTITVVENIGGVGGEHGH